MAEALRRFPGPLLALAFVALQLLDARTYPLFGYDETLLNEAGWHLVQAGEFRSDIRSLQPGFESRYLWQPPALSLSAAVSYALFGLGLVQTRLPGIVFGGLGIWAMYRLALAAGGLRAGAWVAATLLFLWPSWIATAKISRMDTGAIVAMLVATCGIVRWLRDADASGSRGLLPYGLAGGIGAMFHTVALPWCLALCCVLLIFSRGRLAPPFWFGVGVAVPCLAWLGYGLATPRDFELQFLDHLLVRTAGGGGLLGRLAGEAQRHADELARLPALLPLIAVGAWGHLRYRPWRQRPVAGLLVLASIVVVLHALVAGKDSGYYQLYPATLLLCLVAIGVGAVIAAAATPAASRLPGIVALASLALFAANAAAVSFGPRLLAAWKQGPQRDYALQMAPLRAVLVPGDTVWGDPVAWLAAVEAGATFKASNWAERSSLMVADPKRDRYVVVSRGKSFRGMENYRKILEFGQELPLVFGRPLTDKSYTFDLWRSTSPD